MTVGAACAAGATALGTGADLLRGDVVDVVIAGGYDALCRFVMRGFDALRSLTRERVRPFDRRRSGLLLGEAAALVLMTRDERSGDRSSVGCSATPTAAAPRTSRRRTRNAPASHRPVRSRTPGPGPRPVTPTSG